VLPDPIVPIALMAAGNARRMGGENKLLKPFRGKPLIAHAALAVHEARNAPKFVVTGRDNAAIAETLRPFGFAETFNPRFETGFGTSLAAAMNAVVQIAPKAAGILVMLGDMPFVTAMDLDRMTEHFVALGCHAVVRAADHGKPGNPVIVPRQVFAAMAQLNGDDGAKRLIESAGLATHLVEIGKAALIDLDTPELFALYQEGGF
jgi:molybdenum cofactor cytidylyltransferase